MFIHKLRLSIDSRESKSEQEYRFPSSDQIPAISAVIHDVGLFRVLVRCLHTSTMAADSASTALVEAGHHPMGRKRSLSMAGEYSNKIMKIGHSPVPTSRAMNLQDMTRNSNNSRKPTLNLQVLAGTILFAAFEHLDHWPVPLVKAYAEDCFGPRQWVDHKQCALLVANLALAHSSSAADGERDESATLEADAAAVADTYRKFDVFLHDNTDVTSSRTPLRRAGSDSQGSGLVAAVAASANGTFRKQLSSMSSCSVDSRAKKGVVQQKRQRKNNPQQGMDSDSGDEEDSLIKQSLSDLSNPLSKNDDVSCSSSGGEDVDLARKRKQRGGSGPPTSPGGASEHDTTKGGTALLLEGSLPSVTLLAESSVRGESNGDGLMGSNETLYPIAQRNLRLQRIRRRFFGENQESAQEAITASFADRLDVKSKNSNLLQCLPSFTSIPGVRCLIAANLEKWLQSPALAGLARTLFSSTVKHMKNVDPPLPEDMQAIDSIIGMRLKANQVSVTSRRLLFSRRYCLTSVPLVPDRYSSTFILTTSQLSQRKFQLLPLLTTFIRSFFANW